MKLHFLYQLIVIILLTSCNSSYKDASIEMPEVSKEMRLKIELINQNNVVYETKVYQYPDTCIIRGNKIFVHGHEKKIEIDFLEEEKIDVSCNRNFDYKIQELVSWSFQEPDYVVPSICEEGDSLVLSSKPRSYRGGISDAWLNNYSTNTKYEIDTRYFFDIILMMQINREYMLIFFHPSIKYGEDKYSFKYAILKMN